MTPRPELRRRLLGLAYRMLGSAADAEDVLQDAWLKVRDVEGVADETGYMVTVVTRLCLDRLRSAPARRETYVGPWLPEPIATTDEVDPESVSLAFVALLERLSPVERAVFVLKQVFELEHAEIARALGLGDAATRQLFVRAKAHVESERPRFAPSREAHERLLSAFLLACAAGDVEGLKSMLASDARATTDSGGKVRAARNVLRGSDAVARFFVGITRKGAADGVSVEVRDVNGWPAAVLSRGGTVESVLVLETDGAVVLGVSVVSNPDKLGAV